MSVAYEYIMGGRPETLNATSESETTETGEIIMGVAKKISEGLVIRKEIGVISFLKKEPIEMTMDVLKNIEDTQCLALSILEVETIRALDEKDRANLYRLANDCGKV